MKHTKRLIVPGLLMICTLLLPNCSNYKMSYTCFTVKSNVNTLSRIIVINGAVKSTYLLQPMSSLSLKCTDAMGKKKFADFTYIDGMFDSLFVQTFQPIVADTFDTLQTYRDYKLQMYWTFAAKDDFHGDYTLSLNAADFK